MNFIFRNPLVTFVLFTLLGLPVELAAQETQDHHQHRHHHYQLIEIGTFGGPQSYVFDGYGFFAPKVINDHGRLAGAADTSEPDPCPNACFNLDCFVAHAFRMEEGGELSDLGALPGGGTSLPLGISAGGLIAGISENGQLDPLVPAFQWAVRSVRNAAVYDG